MAKINNIIVLNGKRYDAVTGVLINKTSHNSIIESSAPKPKTHVVHRSVVDGIVKQGTLLKTTLRPIPVKPAPVAHKLKKVVVHPVKHLAAHRPEHSKTLVRYAVKAPRIEPKKSLKVTVPTDLIKKQPAAMTVKPKLSSDRIDRGRAERAKQVPRSSSVVHFHRAFRPTVRVATIASRRPHNQAVDTVRGTDGITTVHTHIPKRPSMFEQAIAAANSHQEPQVKESPGRKTRSHARKHARLLSISVAIFATLLLGSYVAYQNKANIQLQLAGATAGFHVSVPRQNPVGFTVKGLTYSPGTATIAFRSNNQTFNIVQKASNWDSQTLLDNFVATSGETYQTYQAAGRTVYVYSNGNATWVNSGVWYQVVGDAHLNNNQLINLATSM